MVRIAIVSDIHGNRTAFEAVLADLRQTSPDLIFHGGDLAEGGAGPVETVDQIRDAGCGSVGLSYDGDRRAAYLVLDESKPVIRRVEYDVDREIKALSGCGLRHANWVTKILNSASAQMP